MDSDEEEAYVPRKHHDFKVNIRLVNPFNGLSHAAMNQLLREFMETTAIDTDWLIYIRKGAFLAQGGMKAFDRPREDGLSLRDSEVKALMSEATRKWDQPFILYALVACCSLGAAVQGWDETAVNQAQLFFALPRNQGGFGLGGTPEHPNQRLGWINSAPYLCCAILGCWLTEPLNRYLGRRGALFVACLVSSASCLGQAFTNNWWQMLIARFCLGLGLGPKSATAPIYASECAPKNIRGGLVMMWQMWTAFGLFMGYLSGVALNRLGWRLVIGSPVSFSMFLRALYLMLIKCFVTRWFFH